jgi:hypothetical protein
MLLRMQGRLRFIESRLEKLPDDRWRAHVVVGGAEERQYVGNAERSPERDGDVWCVAEATAAAFREAVNVPAAALSVRDVVAFDIDGSPAIAVSLTAELQGRKRKLFGLCQTDEDRARGAALAVLSATNRFFGDG